MKHDRNEYKEFTCCMHVVKPYLVDVSFNITKWLVIVMCCIILVAGIDVIHHLYTGRI